MPARVEEEQLDEVLPEPEVRKQLQIFVFDYLDFWLVLTVSSFADGFIFQFLVFLVLFDVFRASGGFLWVGGFLFRLCCFSTFFVFSAVFGFSGFRRFFLFKNLPFFRRF